MVIPQYQEMIHSYIALCVKCAEDKIYHHNLENQLQVSQSKTIINQPTSRDRFGLEPSGVLDGSDNSLDLQVIVETVDTFLSSNATR